MGKDDPERTQLVTAFDQPALGGVYKLTAVRCDDEPWEERIKLSEQSVKVSIPGILQVRRFKDASGNFVADAIYDTLTAPNGLRAAVCSRTGELLRVEKEATEAALAQRGIKTEVFEPGSCTMAEQIQANRELYGFSYIVVTEFNRGRILRLEKNPEWGGPEPEFDR